ncbi:MAG: PspA/IM30 family protein [Myxococcales bacterium]|nr:PspA/IM30 family protein [Myxococcales bacterium]
MGILSRISKVLESNLNALVEKAEDPAKMLDQAIEDMRRGKEEARAAIIEAKTQKRLLERKRDKGLADAQAYERKALQALKNNDEGLARKAIELKLAAEQRAAAEDSAVQEQESQIAQLSAAERELDQRLSQLPARKAALMARQAAAQAKGARVGAAAKAKNSVSGALDAFERMEEKIIRAEVEAEVIQERDPHSLLLDAGSFDHETDEALALLKAKMLKELPAHAGADVTDAEVVEEGEEAAPDPVADSLAELKAKLG